MKKPINLVIAKDEIKNKRTKIVSEKFEVRKKKYEETKELRQMVRKKKEENVQNVRNERKRVEEMRKRRELNDFKSGQYQVIKNTQKLKKWKVKARKLLQKLPPEIFYNNVNK